LIVGILEDKNIPQICEILGSVASKIIAVPVGNNRTVPADNLAGIFRARQLDASVTTARSLDDALAQAARDPLVLVSGSLYLIGEALELLGEVPASGERALNEWSTRPR
jgi:folylpolyglutamate synthase/dihydropteroate synthase